MIKIADTLEPGNIRLYLLKLGMFGVVVLGVSQWHKAITTTGSRPIERQTQGEDQKNHFVPDRTRLESATYIHLLEVFLTVPALPSTLQRTQQGTASLQGRNTYSGPLLLSDQGYRTGKETVSVIFAD